MALAFTFSGVTPYADAYLSKHTDAPDSLESALRNAPPGATVDGAVYWQVYRDLVTNVVLLNPQSGTRLAQYEDWRAAAGFRLTVLEDNPPMDRLRLVADRLRG